MCGPPSSVPLCYWLACGQMAHRLHNPITCQLPILDTVHSCIEGHWHRRQFFQTSILIVQCSIVTGTFHMGPISAGPDFIPRHLEGP